MTGTTLMGTTFNGLNGLNQMGMSQMGMSLNQMGMNGGSHSNHLPGHPSLPLPLPLTAHHSHLHPHPLPVGHNNITYSPPPAALLHPDSAALLARLVPSLHSHSHSLEFRGLSPPGTQLSHSSDSVTAATERTLVLQTGAECSSSNTAQLSHPSIPASDSIFVVPRGPPDFSKIVPERATRYTFDLHTRAWNALSVLVKLDPVPFSRGALRLVYHLQDLNDADESLSPPSPFLSSPSHSPSQALHLDGVQQYNTSDMSVSRSSTPMSVDMNPPSLEVPRSFVAKISMDPRDNEDRDIYFRDVEMQTLAKYYANLFNEYSPPKLIDFVKASILRLEERQSQPLCGVERYIEGAYRKWNNNFGFVSEDERNTPQAFSHFTYECSNHRLLICDIQGVSDLYTDPQCHSVDSDAIGGKGNLGQRGIDRFLQTHRCNAICRYLKLPSINADYSDLGTLPVTQYMSYEQVKLVNIQHFPRTEISDVLLNHENAQRTQLAMRERTDDFEEQQCRGCILL